MERCCQPLSHQVCDIGRSACGEHIQNREELSLEKTIKKKKKFKLQNVVFYLYGYLYDVFLLLLNFFRDLQCSAPIGCVTTGDGHL